MTGVRGTTSKRSSDMPSAVQLPLVSCLLLFCLICLHQFPNGALSCAPADRIALSAFSNHLDTAVNEWPVNYSSDCCRWLGVRCSRFGSQELRRVLSLDLAGRGLKGVLSSRLVSLDKLRLLNLSGNSLHGAVPSELLRMENLRVLDLSQNGFTGELGGDAPPSPAPNTSGIRVLDISFNSLSSLHAGLFLGLPHLRNFSAETNLLAGPVPATLSACTELEYLNMANNSLHGNLGSFNFSRLTRLRALHLGWNWLNGRLPASLSRCRDLRVVNLRRNSLSGPVPSSFRRLQSLAFFDVGVNSITGIAHALRVLQECRALAVLILTTNFRGEAMPDADAGIRGFPSMRLIGIANCALTGAVPTWLLASSRLSVLDMSWNRLAGHLPAWLGSFGALFRVDLSGNALTGEIPASLTRLKSLAGNNASGVQHLSLYEHYGVRIYNWHVERGQLWYDSYIPPSLDLSRNGLTGAIPQEIGNLRALNLLNLSWNSLSGFIPGSLASMSFLQTLDLSNNELAGEIPSSLAVLTFLSSFDVSCNQLNGAIPDLGQFSTFPCSSFAGNHGLYGKYCDGQADARTPGTDGAKSFMIVIEDFLLPFWLGMVTGVSATVFAHVLVLERTWTS